MTRAATSTDLISGRTSLMFDTVAAINVQIKANTVRALGVTTLQRSSVLPDRAHHRRERPARLRHQHLGRAARARGHAQGGGRQAECRGGAHPRAARRAQTLQDAGIEPGQGSPEQVSAFLEKEMVKWAKVAKDAGIQPE
jgi:hypothetical protein